MPVSCKVSIAKKNNKRKLIGGEFHNPIGAFRRKADYNDEGEPNWCEFMMWDRAKDSDYPMMLAYKYFANEENDKEVERRLSYGSKGV